jgi:DNA ligase D-like protein (predicted 3'-phosphoesterase)
MTGKNGKLDSYHQKRDFRRTPEPEDDTTGLEWSLERPIFVVQKHDASTLHYDFRLEIDGVLKSWAVPKGPSTDPREKRLAIPTEDHPLGYADFEGTIPEDSYGGGTVLIWDRGPYHNLKEGEDGADAPSVARQLEDGHLTIWLQGQKISGGYGLIRTDMGDAERWLLVKVDDAEADARRNPTSTEQSSVKSGRTLEQIRRKSCKHEDQ